MHIKIIDSEGVEQVAEGEPGESVMRCATRHLVRGIVGECGGALACATCHGYVGRPWLALFPPPTHHELDMLEGCIDLQANSRLTCQLILAPACDGLTIHVPKSQT